MTETSVESLRFPYALVVLTHGDDAEPLRRTLDSFAEHVTPAPIARCLVVDGQVTEAMLHALAFDARDERWKLASNPTQDGFCAATRRMWRIAAANPYPYVFWLEHDFVFTRPVDLAQLGAVLDDRPTLTQMALMRDAVNPAERAAGGLYESRPGQYEFRSGWREDVGNLPWLEHRSYFTTNPSLMRTAWMAEHPWPDYPAECEGRFGIDLVQHGYSFGVWGSGEPWVAHIGQRTGHGY